MKLGGAIKISNNLLLFIFGLTLMFLVRFNVMGMVTEGLTNEEQLYFNKDTYEPNVYNSFSKQSDASQTADYWRNLNPYDNQLLPVDSGDEPITDFAMKQRRAIQNTEPGIPAKEIPVGQEDMYILKSKIVPPVCPACPAAVQGDKEKCPPCPACERCPESNFTCKKVPNYRNMDSNRLPDFLPRMASSSHF